MAENYDPATVPFEGQQEQSLDTVETGDAGLQSNGKDQDGNSSDSDDYDPSETVTDQFSAPSHAHPSSVPVFPSVDGIGNDVASTRQQEEEQQQQQQQQQQPVKLLSRDDAESGGNAGEFAGNTEEGGDDINAGNDDDENDDDDDGDFSQALRNAGAAQSTPAESAAPSTPAPATSPQPDASAAAPATDEPAAPAEPSEQPAEIANGTEQDDEDQYDPSSPANLGPSEPSAAAESAPQAYTQQSAAPLSENENTNDISHVPAQPQPQPQQHASAPTSVPPTTAPSVVVSTPVPQSITPALDDPYSSRPTSTAPFPEQGRPDLVPSQLSTRAVTESATATATPVISPMKPKGRLPSDTLGILEDRIAADPKGDMEAWIQLMEEYKRREKIDEVRDVFERFLKYFPGSGELWVAYANLESQCSELYRLEQIFNRSLLNVPYVQLWGTYLDYVRRRNNLTNDPSGQARSIITSAYDFALQKIGIDKDSAQIWVDYIQFLRTAPGIIGGTTWQDQQKMDTLRKAYQRAVIVPMQALNTLWKEYDQFEMGLNKLTGRRFLQERSPAYMTARSSYTELQNITQALVRTTLPRLPPLPGCEGYEEFQKQLAIWRRWIQWEIDDPLVFKEEDSDAYKARVLYVYRQAIMAMRFVPELWFEAATFCFDNGLESEGDEFLKEGIEANPESCLLAFKRADRLEVTSTDEHDTKRRGAKVREAYDKVLDALYELIAKARTQEATAVAAVEEKFANMPDEDVDQAIEQGSNNEDDDNEGETPKLKTKESMKKTEIDAVKAASGARITQLSKTVSFAWIALMRAMRRVQGKGKPGEMAGSRQVFADARKRGRITSDVYIASALLEHHCYKDPAATKIFERGSKLFPEDENFALEYLKHLIDINDMTNARAVFETSTRRLTANPKTVHKSKVLYRFMHEHESRYGDMVQILSIESRMRELFPEDPVLERFASRYSGPSFDLMNVHLALSPMQTLPCTRRVEPTSSREPSVEILKGGPRYLTGSPGRAGDSPSKRPYPGDYDLDEYSRPRKYQRAESPLKGAAGRRVDQKQRQFAHSAQPSLSGLSAAVNPLAGASASGSRGTAAPPPPMAPQPLPKDIMFLLSIIPGAKTYDATRFSPEKMVALLRSLDIPSSVRDLRLPPGVQGGGDIMGMGMAGKRYGGY